MFSFKAIVSAREESLVFEMQTLELFGVFARERSGKGSAIGEIRLRLDQLKKQGQDVNGVIVTRLRGRHGGVLRGAIRLAVAVYIPCEWPSLSAGEGAVKKDSTSAKAFTNHEAVIEWSKPSGWVEQGANRKGRAAAYLSGKIVMAHSNDGV